MGSQTVGHDWATELNWTELKAKWLDFVSNPLPLYNGSDNKGLDLIDRVPEEQWMDVCNIVQEAVIKTIPKKKKRKKAKWLSEEDLQRAEKRS